MPTDSARSKQAQTAVKPLKRGRACMNCRFLKIKCDGEKPICGPCRMHPKDDECEYADGPGRSRTKVLEDAVSRLEARLLELESSERSLPSVALHDNPYHLKGWCNSKSPPSHNPDSPAIFARHLSPFPLTSTTSSLPSGSSGHLASLDRYSIPMPPRLPPRQVPPVTIGPSSHGPVYNPGSSSSSDDRASWSSSRAYSGMHAVVPPGSESSFFSSASNIGIGGGQFSIDSSSYRNNTNLTINFHHGPPADNIRLSGEPFDSKTGAGPSSLHGSAQYSQYQPYPRLPYSHTPSPFESPSTTDRSFLPTRHIREGFNPTHPYDIPTAEYRQLHTVCLSPPAPLTPQEAVAESSRTGRRRLLTEEDTKERPTTKRIPRASPQNHERRNTRSSPSSDSNEELADDGADNGRRLDPHQPTFASPKKKRTSTLTPHQSAVLHAFLAQSRFPTTAMREEVGRSIGLSARKVQIWFQNQRQMARRPRIRSDTPTRRPPYGPFPCARNPYEGSDSI